MLAEIRTNNVYICRPQYYYIKVRFNGVKLYRHVFVMMASVFYDIVSTFSCIMVTRWVQIICFCVCKLDFTEFDLSYMEQFIVCAAGSSYLKY